MPGLIDDHLTRLAFSVYENRGVYALLIGSGLSRAAEIPTGWEITLDLIRRVAIAQGMEERADHDWAAWYREANGKDPDYSELVGALGLSPDERRSILHDYIEPSAEDREESRKVPTDAHYAIAHLVRDGYIRVIVTTNFDRLLENALRESGVEPTVVASVDTLKGAEPLTHTKCYLLKLNGDYKDARILNTDAELSSYPPEYDKLLDRIFDEHGLIVSGWSGEWDHALRAAITRSPARRYTMFWTALGQPGMYAEELIKHRGGCLISIADADEFFTGIRDRIETLGRTHRRNPQSVALLINSAKRYLEKPEYRIRLDELLDSEAQSLLKKLEGAALHPHGSWSPEEFRRRVDVYEAATEPLARTAGVLGRWGDDNEFETTADVIRSLHSCASQERSGLVHWIDLRSYPAVLLVAAYGIGLVFGKRWRTLHRLLTETIESESRQKPQRIVEELFLCSWEGGNDQGWKNLEGLESRKTALSDHLCDLFAKWGESFVGIAPNFERLYETWEVLSSLTYCERYDLVDLQAALPGTATQSTEIIFVPVGRSKWHSQTRERILDIIQNDDFKHDLLEAGFGKGEQEFLDATIGIFRVAAGRMGW